MQIDRAAPGVSADCERILRTLPLWFGIESALMAYAREAEVWPTFVARVEGHAVAFLTVREHMARSWELHCIAVAAAFRSQGLGRRLHDHVQAWLVGQGAHFLQAKTLGAAHPSPEYALTRGFYRTLGYAPLEVFPQLWGDGLPVLQMVKVLGPDGASA